MESEINASDASVDRVVHTPGPWAWEVLDKSMMILGKSDGRGVDLMHEVLAVTRCEACQERADIMLCHMPNPQNAKLIAAAPELLKALLEIAANPTASAAWAIAEKTLVDLGLKVA